MELDQLLRFAVKHGISDVHLKVGKPPFFRRDGRLVTQKGAPPVTIELMDGWLADIAPQKERARFAEQCEADFAHAIQGVGRFRVNAFMQRGMTGLVFRHIPPVVKSIADLGLPETLADIAMNHRGLVLVTGATGSGKSTTLAAMIRHINEHRACHIVTVEDPIEFTFEDQTAIINQREVGQDTMSFAAALRAALRQDPDVILLGELRDLETMETALHAAETGHLVMSTLHTVDAMETVSRFIGMFPPHQQNQVRLQLSTILRAVVSQRLVRTLGSGRTAACEIMVGNEFVRELIADAERTVELPLAIKQGGANYGMQSFDQHLYDLWKHKRISKEEALSSATNPSDLKLRFEGIHAHQY